MRSTPREEPHLGSFKLSRSVVLGWVLYLLLVVSAGAAFFGGARPALVPEIVRSVAPVAFGAFLALFALYRFALVRARRYPAGRAFWQVAIGVVFLMLLTIGRPPQDRRAAEGEESGGAAARVAAPNLAPLMAHPDASVRAAACELARHRANGVVYARALAVSLRDDDASVRGQALASLRALAGSDIGGADPGAAERWSAWAAEQPAPTP